MEQKTTQSIFLNLKYSELGPYIITIDSVFTFVYDRYILVHMRKIILTRNEDKDVYNAPNKLKHSLLELSKNRII